MIQSDQKIKKCLEHQQNGRKQKSGKLPEEVKISERVPKIQADTEGKIEGVRRRLCGFDT